MYINPLDKRSRPLLLANETVLDFSCYNTTTLFSLLLDLLLVIRINVFEQKRPLPHSVIELLCLAVSELRLRPVDVDAIHDPLLEMQVRRDGQENGGLGSGDLLYELQRITLA